MLPSDSPWVLCTPGTKTLMSVLFPILLGLTLPFNPHPQTLPNLIEIPLIPDALCRPASGGVMSHPATTRALLS